MSLSYNDKNMRFTMEEEQLLREKNLRLYEELQTLRLIGADEEEIRFASEAYQRSSELYMRRYGVLCEENSAESQAIAKQSKKRRMSKLMKGFLMSCGGLAAVIVVAVTMGELFSGSAEDTVQKTTIHTESEYVVWEENGSGTSAEDGYLICTTDYQANCEQDDFIVLGEDTRVPALNSVKTQDLKTVRRCYKWTSHDGKTELKYCPNIYQEYYDVYRSAARYMESNDFHRYVDDDINSSFVTDIANHIRQMCTGLGYSEWETAMEAINFVQNIPFKTDEESTGTAEWPKYVIETLYDGCGDCEDKAFLLTAVLKEMGYGAVLLVYDSHMAVGIAGDPQMDGFSVQFGSSYYFYVEPTTPGWSIGQIPKNLSSSQYAVVTL